MMTSHAKPEQVVAVRRHGEEELEEEQCDDREIVAGEPPRRESDEQPHDGSDRHDQRDREDRR